MAVYIKEASKMPFYGEKPNRVYRFTVSADTAEELQQFVNDKAEHNRLDNETGRIMYFTKFPKFRQGKLVRTSQGKWVLDTTELDVLGGQLENASGILAEKLAEKLMRLTTECDQPEGRVKFLNQPAETEDSATESDELGEL